MPKRYYLSQIRTLLNEGFTDEEIRQLCYDTHDFRPVYDQLAQTTGKTEIIHRLVEHADRKDLLEHLLTWTQEHNPTKYERYSPYYGTTNERPEKTDGLITDEPVKKLAMNPIPILATTAIVVLCISSVYILFSISRGVSPPSIIDNKATPTNPPDTPILITNLPEPICPDISTFFNIPIPTLTVTPTPEKFIEADTLYNEAVNRYNAKDYEGAIVYLDKAIAINPNNADFYYYRAAARYAHYNQSKPKNSVTDLDLAIADLEKAIAIKPIDDDNYSLRGLAHKNRGDLEKAIIDFTCAIAINHNAAHHISRGLVYRDLNDQVRAIIDFDKAIAIDPNAADAYYQRGLVLLAKDKSEEAVADFKKVLKLSNDPNLRRLTEEQLQALGVK